MDQEKTNVEKTLPLPDEAATDGSEVTGNDTAECAAVTDDGTAECTAVTDDGTAECVAVDDVDGGKPPQDVPRYRFPKISIALFIVAGISAIIYIAAMLSTDFANFYSRYPGGFIRALLAHLTNFIPFSLAEGLLIFLPVCLVFLIVIAIKKFSNSWHNTFVYVGILLSAASVLFSLFVLGFGTGYYTSPLDERLGIDRELVSPEELYATASILAQMTNENAAEVSFRDKNFSVMPYSRQEMNEKLIEAYDKVCDKYSFIQRLNSSVKPVMLSEPWSYTHITGVYSYFTGEANINVVFPDYTIPYTAAHELAHQRGIAREDEANFVAFLVCIESDDPYIRYSGYLNVYEYVASSLWSADHDMYYDVYSTLSTEVRYEMKAYSEFFDKYRDNVAATVSGAVNDTYLKLQGTVGEKSYGMVTDLAVAYYKKSE